ncbi:HEAT repeat domain-containing protein [Acidobacteriota bacterium]
MEHKILSSLITKFWPWQKERPGRTKSPGLIPWRIGVGLVVCLSFAQACFGTSWILGKVCRGDKDQRLLLVLNKNSMESYKISESFDLTYTSEGMPVNLIPRQDRCRHIDLYGGKLLCVRGTINAAKPSIDITELLWFKKVVETEKKLVRKSNQKEIELGLQDEAEGRFLRAVSRYEKVRKSLSFLKIPPENIYQYFYKSAPDSDVEEIVGLPQGWKEVLGPQCVLAVRGKLLEEYVTLTELNEMSKEPKQVVLLHALFINAENLEGGSYETLRNGQSPAARIIMNLEQELADVMLSLKNQYPDYPVGLPPDEILKKALAFAENRVVKAREMDDIAKILTLPPADAVPLLVSLARRSTSKEIRQAAIRAIAESPQSLSTSTLVGMLGDFGYDSPIPSILAERPDKVGLTHIVDAIRGGNDIAAANGLRSLGYLKKLPEGFLPGDYLFSSNSEVIKAAIFCLRETGGEESLDYLVKALKHPRDDVVRQALSSIIILNPPFIGPELAGRIGLGDSLDKEELRFLAAVTLSVSGYEGSIPEIITLLRPPEDETGGTASPLLGRLEVLRVAAELLNTLTNQSEPMPEDDSDSMEKSLELARGLEVYYASVDPSYILPEEP